MFCNGILTPMGSVFRGCLFGCVRCFFALLTSAACPANLIFTAGCISKFAVRFFALFTALLVSIGLGKFQLLLVCKESCVRVVQSLFNICVV